MITQSRKSCLGLLQGVLFTRDNVDIGRIYGRRERESEKKNLPGRIRKIVHCFESCLVCFKTDKPNLSLKMIKAIRAKPFG